MTQPDAAESAPAAPDYAPLLAGHRRKAARRQAQADAIAELVWAHWSPRSVVDVGCGLGFFLNAAARRGAAVQGVEGPWVAQETPAVPRDVYRLADLERPLAPGLRADLCVCLEVAEHLTPERGPGFVDDLCAVSDWVLFSAAVPGQKGRGHLNCRWQSYWARAFAERGYRCYDPFRGPLAGQRGMAPWFVQNLLLYGRQTAPVPATLAPHAIPVEAADRIAPATYRRHVEQLKRLLREHRRALRSAQTALAEAGQAVPEVDLRRVDAPRRKGIAR